MQKRRSILLAACLLAGTAVMSGCAVQGNVRSTPKPAQQQTAQPTIAPTEPPQAEESKRLTLKAGETVVKADALMEQGRLLLPLMETGEALGWKAETEQTEEETRIKRVVTLTKDESRITVSWTVSDNTVGNISWQKDGLLIPVDTRITTVEEIVYVPAAFFEKAMDIAVEQMSTNVILSTPKPADTPKLEEDSSGEND